MIRTALCDLLEIDHPIVQGGMAWVATAELAVAVSEAGGLGVIGAGNAPPEWVAEQVRRVRSQTERPFGVNIPLFSPFVQQVIDLCVQERVPVVTTHSLAVHAVFEREVSVDAARRVLADAPGVVVYDDPERGEFPTPNDVVGTDPTWVGRLRQHQDDPTALELFVCGDNLRKGAALNTAQIAEVVAAELSV